MRYKVFRSLSIAYCLNFDVSTVFWNKVFYLYFLQLVLSEHSVQEIKVEAFDKDLDADDFLGRYVLLVSQSLP